MSMLTFVYQRLNLQPTASHSRSECRRCHSCTHVQSPANYVSFSDSDILLLSNSARLRARLSHGQGTISQCFTCSICCMLLALVCLLALCLLCSSHGPFIARSAGHFPPCQGFTQLMHSSRCSQPLRATVCFCFCSVLSLLFHLRRRLDSDSGVWRSTVSRKPILQTCSVVVRMQRLVSFQHLRSSSLQAPS